MTALARRTPELVMAAVVTAVTIALAARLHWFFVSARVGAVGFDEGYIAAIGERMIDGRFLPYVDGASHRGPLLYWISGIAEWLGGRFSWTAIRVASLAANVTTLLACFAIGVVARVPVAGAIGALGYAYFAMFVLGPGTGIALNGEVVAAPLAVLAVLFTAALVYRATSERQRTWFAAAAGVFAGLAVLAKQTMLPTVFPLALWIAADGWADEMRALRSRVRVLAALLLGFVSPLAAVVVRYALAGELGTFWYWFYSYNASIYMKPFEELSRNSLVTTWVTNEAFAVFTVVAVVAFGLSRALGALGAFRLRPREEASGEGTVARAYRAVGLEATLAWLSALTLLSVMAPMRFWAHYFLVLAPWLGLLVGVRTQSLLATDQRRVEVMRAAGVLLILGSFVAWALDARLNGLRSERATLWTPALPDPICDVVAQHSKPDQPIFVWGFDGDLYITCERRPASRFTYLTLVAGLVPPNWDRVSEDLVARGARETLATELDVAKPPIILDLPARIGGHSIRDVPLVKDVLTASYCEVLYVTGARGRLAGVWTRKNGAACPPPPAPPAPHILRLLPFQERLSGERAP